MNGKFEPPLKIIQEYFGTAPFPPFIEYSGIIWGVTGLINHEPKVIIYGAMTYAFGRAFDKFQTILSQNKHSENKPNAESLEQKLDE